MKNTFKVFGIIAIIAVIGFSMAACKNGTTPTTPPGVDDTGGTITGSTITSGAPVTYTAGLPEEAKSRTNFSYTRGALDTWVLLSTIIDPPASVTITNGKVDIKLGTPKSASLEIITETDIPADITVTPSDAKSFRIRNFYTDDGAYNLYPAKGDDREAALIYADKNVTLQGTHTSPGLTEVYDISLKQGWNYVIYSESGSTVKNTASTTLPNGFKWTVSN